MKSKKITLKAIKEAWESERNLFHGQSVWDDDDEARLIYAVRSWRYENSFMFKKDSLIELKKLYYGKPYSILPLPAEVC